MKQPLVSVCIPTFNGAEFLQECLNSVCAQTYENLEVVISDDASTDKTMEIINVFKKSTNFKVYVYNHQPSGIGANWNNCIKYANGQYIKFLFQDDVLESNCVERLMAMMLSESNIAMVYAKRNFIYLKETPDILEFKKVYAKLHNYWLSFNLKEGVVDGKIYLKDENFLNAPKNKIGEPTSVLLNKDCFEKVGFFNEALKQALDCEFWSRLMPLYKIGFVDAYLSSFRLHTHQTSAMNKAKKVSEMETLYFIYYKTLLTYLHKDCQWKLRKRFHPIISKIVKLKSRLT